MSEEEKELNESTDEVIEEQVEEHGEENNKKDKKNNKKKKIFIIILILLILIGLGVFAYIEFMPTKEEVKTKSKPVESKYRIESNGLENFDLQFLKLENKDDNIIYSPLSIKYALAMLAEGANGETKEQITSLIGDYKANKYINSKNMSFANAMFIKDTYKNNIKEDYIKNLSEKYSADIVFDSFQTPDKANSWVKDKTLGLINDLFDDISEEDFILVNALGIDMDWNHRLQYSTSNSTTPNPEQMYMVRYLHEKYTESIGPISTDDSYYSLKFNNETMEGKAVEIGASINNYDIVKELGEENIRNTITKEYTEYIAQENAYFDSSISVDEYVDNFIKELDSNYKKLDVSTDFMIYNDKEVKAFAKDLKEYDGTTLQYIGIMPKYQDINNYIENIDKDGINNIINNLKTIENKNFSEGKVTKITGYIPLFKFDNKIDLMKDLKTLGVKEVFDESKADLSKMTKDKAFINQVSHKANIDFSNDGIKAAAATEAGGMGAATGGFEHLYDVPVEIIDMTFNNPYIFLIRDKKTGEVWFAGKVYKPTENPCKNPNEPYNKCVK